MKPFELFKAGTHTSANGTTLQFGEAELQQAVAAYDPALHEAPIVVGHPKDNGPAYGWVKSLSFADGTMVAEPQQVDEAFAEMVQAGRFKKRSASFYTPDAPNNPKPGTWYLRHVGFLGAMPPAVKGLKDVSFHDDEGAVVLEFGEAETRWGFSSLATIMRGLREWFLAEKGAETADKLLPNWALADLEQASKAPPEPISNPAAMPAFSEGKPAMTIEELQAQVAKLTQERDAAQAAAAKVANFGEAEANLATREAAVREAEAKLARAAIETRVDAAIKAGRLLSKQRAHAIEFAASLQEGEQVINFGEGDQAKKVSQREAYLLGIEQGPKLVDFNEHAPAGDPPAANAADPVAIANKARAINADRAAKGQPELSFTEAVAQATAELTA